MRRRFIPALLKLSSILFGVFANFALAAHLGKDDFGAYGALISIFGVCLVFSNLGINYSLLDSVPKMAREKVGAYSAVITRYALVSSIIVGLLAYPYIKTEFDLAQRPKAGALIIVIMIVLFQNLNLINVAMLRSIGRYNRALFFESNTLNLFLLFAVGLSLSNVEGVAFYLLLGGFFCSFAASTIALKSSFVTMGGASFRPTADQSRVEGFSLFNAVPFVFLSIAEAISTNLDVVLINSLFGTEATADYFLAKKLLVIFGFFWYLYNYVYTPRISKLFRHGECIDPAQVVEIIRKKWMVLALTCGVAVPIALSSRAAIDLLGRHEYMGMVTYLYGFLAFSIIHVLTGPVVSFLNVAGLKKFSPIVVGFGAVVFLSTVFPLAQTFGPLGVLISMNISLISWKILGLYVIKKRTGFDLLCGRYAK